MLARGTKRVDEVEVESESDLLKSMESRIVYEDSSDMSLKSWFLSNVWSMPFYSFCVLFFGVMIFFSVYLTSYSQFYMDIIGFVGVIFSGVLYIVSIFKLLTFRDDCNPCYYIIGEDKVVEIPENQSEVGRVMDRNNIQDVVFDDCFIEFSGEDEVIGFSIPERDFVEVQDVVYGFG